MKYLDQLPTYVRELHGVSQVSMAYLIRESSLPPNPLPGLETNVPWADGHTSLIEELISFTPHTGPNYDADNARLFGILSKSLSGTAAMASITKHQTRRNGRGAYLALITHHLGSAKWEKMVELAESVLNTRVWNGKNARYPLGIHIARHREAFNDMERASDHISFNPPNETSRVRYLMTSIQTQDATLCSCKTAIQADTAKKNDFELAADFILTNMPQQKESQIHRIAGLHSRRGGNKKGKVKVGPKTGVELRFYKKGEWFALTQEQRDECMEIRRHQRKKRKAGNSDDTPSSKIAALESQIKAQALQIASLTVPSSQYASDKSVSLPPPPA